MTSVTQCDVCNNVVKHEQSKYIKVFNLTRANVHIVKVCPDCYAKLFTALKLEAKK